MCRGRREGWRKCLCVVGGFCAMCIVSHFYLIGNVGTYIESYLRERGDYPQDATWLISALVTCVFVGGQVGVIAGGYLDRTIGSHFTTLTGLSVIMIGVTLSYWTIQVSTVPLVITFGALPSLGLGTVYGSPYSALNKHNFKNMGVVYGIVNSGFGGGAVVFNVVLSAFINSENRAPDKVNSHGAYFSQDVILDRVPFSFLLLGAMYAVLLPVSVWGTRPPPSPPSEDSDVNIAHVTSDAEKRWLRRDDYLPQNGITKHDTYHSMRSQETVLQTMQKADEENGRGGSGAEGGGGGGVSPRQLFRYCTFYVLWGVVFACGFINNAVVGQYKELGLTHIHNDMLLVSMGTVGSLMSALCRPLWGLLIDYTSFKTAVMVTFTVACTLLGFWRPVLLWSVVCFYVFTVLLFSAVSSVAVFMLVALKGYFGQEHQVANLSVLWTALTVESCLLPVVKSFTMAEYGWDGMLLVLALLALTGMLVSLMLPRELVLVSEVNKSEIVMCRCFQSADQKS